MGSEHKDFKGDIDVPEVAIQVIDDAVMLKLPPGTEATSISAFGASFWTRTARLDTVKDDEPKAYFLKTTSGERGRKMMLGEFTSMSAIYAATPDFCPRPIAWGSYVSIPGVHFFLCDFHEMTDELPELHSFPAKMSDLHRESISPNGKYGFSCTTFHGNTPLDHGWADTWEEYFTTRTKVLLEMEQKAQGPNEEILQLSIPFFEKVVPRLLRPLETGGRSIKPSLVHGDLWHGNTSTDVDTDLPIIYDAACFYAHNEYDLGVWRAGWNKLGKPYFNRYFKHFPIAPPEEDHDDRNLLYATRVNVLDSILYKGYSGYREKLIADMKLLIEKFPDGYEGWAAAQKDHIDTSISLTDDGMEDPLPIADETINEKLPNPQREVIVPKSHEEKTLPVGGAATTISHDWQDDTLTEDASGATEATNEDRNSIPKGQDELNHSIVLQDLGVCATQVQGAPMSDLSQSLVDLENGTAFEGVVSSAHNADSSLPVGSAHGTETFTSQNSQGGLATSDRKAEEEQKVMEKQQTGEKEQQPGEEAEKTQEREMKEQSQHEEVRPQEYEEVKPQEHEGDVKKQVEREEVKQLQNEKIEQLQHEGVKQLQHEEKIKQPQHEENFQKQLEHEENVKKQLEQEEVKQSEQEDVKQLQHEDDVRKQLEHEEGRQELGTEDYKRGQREDIKQTQHDEVKQSEHKEEVQQPQHIEARQLDQDEVKQIEQDEVKQEQYEEDKRQQLHQPPPPPQQQHREQGDIWTAPTKDT